MGRLIRLALVLLVFWAIWHWAAAEWQRFTFEDEVKLIAQFGADRDEDTVRAAVVAAAAKFEVPVAPERVAIRKQGDHVYIDLSYTVPIEILPRYQYPWTYTITAEGWFIPGGRQPLR